MNSIIWFKQDSSLGNISDMSFEYNEERVWCFKHCVTIGKSNNKLRGKNEKVLSAPLFSKTNFTFTNQTLQKDNKEQFPLRRRMYKDSVNSALGPLSSVKE